MKTQMFPRLAGIVAVLVMGVFAVSTAPAQSQPNALRIGVYDSRAIAIAYGGSADFQRVLQSAHKEYDAAKQAKNDGQMQAVKDRMKLQQRRLHEEGFSTGSVAPIMATLKDVLPEVARQADVQLIVSKWELNEQSPDVTVVDVTDQLVALFHPSEKVLKWVKSIEAQPPLPIEKITDDM